MSMKKVMIIEDDVNISKLLKLYLEKEGFLCSSYTNPVEALENFEKENPNIILLDIMLPEMDGYDVCKVIRQKSNVPVIMLTAKGETFDKVLGLELGADDYIVKPFEPKEVLARIKAVIRRFGEKTALNDEKIVELPDIIINMNNYTISYQGKILEIPPKEIELLHFLSSNPNKVFTREQLLSNVWGYDYEGETRTVDVHVKRLREKFEGNSNWEIKTVWGIGYKFQINAV